MFFPWSQAVCPEMNTVVLPLAITIWENPCGKLGNRLSGLMYSFGIEATGHLGCNAFSERVARLRRSRSIFRQNAEGAGHANQGQFPRVLSVGWLGCFIRLPDRDPGEKCILPSLRLCRWRNLCFFR